MKSQNTIHANNEYIIKTSFFAYIFICSYFFLSFQADWVSKITVVFNNTDYTM